MRYRDVFLIMLTAISLAGCASVFDEKHFFKSKAVDAQGQPVNYYRVEVKGTTMLSSSRYISGYFDESAVDRYFNECSQPACGQLAANSDAADAGGGTGGVSGGADAGDC